MRATPAADGSDGRRSGAALRGAAVALGPAAMIAAPVVLLAAMVIHSAHGMDAASWFATAKAAPDRFYAAHLLILVSVALFVPASLALAELARPARPLAAGVGGALSVLGLLGVGVLIGMDLVAWQIARSALGSEQGLALLEATLASPGVVAPVAVLLPGLVLGPGLLTLTLARERVLSTRTAASIPIALAAVFAGLPLAAVAIAAAVVLLAAFGGLGLSLLRGDDPARTALDRLDARWLVRPRRATRAPAAVPGSPQR